MVRLEYNGSINRLDLNIKNRVENEHTEIEDIIELGWRIVFERTGKGIMAMNADGSELTTLLDWGEMPNVSPDGRKIVFSSGINYSSEPMPEEDFENVLELIKKEQADIVIGSRFLGNSKTVPTYRKLGIKAITKISNLETELKVTDSQSGFRAYNKKTIQTLNISERGMGISTEILIKASKAGLKITEVPIKIIYEGDTSTHNATSHGISVLMSTMKFISIEHPLKFYGIPGMIFLALGVFFTIWVVNEYISGGNFPIHVALIGVATIIVGTMLTMAAILLYSLVNVVREK